MLVFVCSPYGGKKKNLEAAREYCLMEVDLGNVPYAPHLLLSQFLSEENDRYIALEMAKEMLERCDQLHAWGEEITEGMRGEIEHAETNGIPVIYMSK